MVAKTVLPSDVGDALYARINGIGMNIQNTRRFQDVHVGVRISTECRKQRATCLVVDGGNPVGMSTTVNSDGSVVDNGGANPVSGYGMFEASDLDDATSKAKGCPILEAGGSVELAEVIDM